MLAHMKMRTTGKLTDICLTVPAEDAGRVMEAVKGVLELAGHTVRCVNDEGEYLYSAKEVFSDVHPGMLLRGLRVKEGITQKELAERLGITQTRVSEMEKGTRNISIDMAKRIGEAYNISYKIFL